MENPTVGIFEGISPHAARGEETEREREKRESACARTSENDRGGLILNPSDWRVLDETRRILATPDGTDALSDVKLKHAALTRRFDDTPYNLASCLLPPSSRPLGTTGFLPLPLANSPVAVPRSRQARDRDSESRKLRLFRTIRQTNSFFFFESSMAHFTRYR